jgi:hypothetical protein
MVANPFSCLKNRLSQSYSPYNNTPIIIKTGLTDPADFDLAKNFCDMPT